jgi:lipopolysaccharide export system protein LptA
VKRKVFIAAAAAWTIAGISPVRGGLIETAYARPAASSVAVVETPPPSGEVQAPGTTIISAATRATATESLAARAAGARRVKTTSIKSADKGPGDRKDSSSDSSPFGGFDSGSNHGPINIKSDTMAFDYKKNTVLFSGHVHAVQTANELYSNTLHVQMNKQSQIQQMIADGNVRMSQGQRWATGDHAVLDETVHTLVLTGSPVVHDGKDQIAGTKITVFLQTNKSEVTDPKAVIFPHETKRPNNGEGSASPPVSPNDNTSAGADAEK